MRMPPPQLTCIQIVAGAYSLPTTMSLILSFRSHSQLIVSIYTLSRLHYIAQHFYSRLGALFRRLKLHSIQGWPWRRMVLLLIQTVVQLLN